MDFRVAGEHSKIRTVIREDPIKLAQYLREKKSYESVVFRANRKYLKALLK